MPRRDPEARALWTAFLVAVFRKATWRQRARILVELARRR